jgi:hypothetical protein
LFKHHLAAAFKRAVREAPIRYFAVAAAKNPLIGFCA